MPVLRPRARLLFARVYDLSLISCVAPCPYGWVYDPKAVDGQGYDGMVSTYALKLVRALCKRRESLRSKKRTAQSTSCGDVGACPSSRLVDSIDLSIDFPFGAD